MNVKKTTVKNKRHKSKQDGYELIPEFWSKVVGYYSEGTIIGTFDPCHHAILSGGKRVLFENIDSWQYI